MEQVEDPPAVELTVLLVEVMHDVMLLLLDAEDCPDANEEDEDPVEMVIGAAVHGIVGLADAQAQRELAAASTAPTEAPQALITQSSAAD